MSKDMDEVCLTGRLYDEFQISKAFIGVLESNSKVMEDLKTGKIDPGSVRNFFLVQVMVALDGKTNPALVRQLIDDFLVIQDSKNN